MRRHTVPLLLAIALSATACIAGSTTGGADPDEPIAQGEIPEGDTPADPKPAEDPGPVVDDPERLAAVIADVVASLPDECRVLEATPATEPDPVDADLGALVAGGIDAETLRGPLVGVRVGEDRAIVATRLISEVREDRVTALWLALDLLAEPTVFAIEGTAASSISIYGPATVDSAGEGELARARAFAEDCTWVVAEVFQPAEVQAPPSQDTGDLVLNPTEAIPGALITLGFPREQIRGVGFRLDREVDGEWQPVAFMTSNGNSDEPTTVLVSEVADGYGWQDVGVGGPGGEQVVLPTREVPPGTYRICTANAAEEWCTTLEIIDS